MKHLCPVCGWPELTAPPYDAAGHGSYEICPCCGFEFGYDDAAKGETHSRYRARWIAGGMQWWSTSRPEPIGWNPAQQLARVTFGSGKATEG